MVVVVVDSLPSFWWGMSGETYDDVLDPVASDNGNTLTAKEGQQEMVVSLLSTEARAGDIELTRQEFLPLFHKLHYFLMFLVSNLLRFELVILTN